MPVCVRARIMSPAEADKRPVSAVPLAPTLLASSLQRLRSVFAVSSARARPVICVAWLSTAHEAQIPTQMWQRCRGRRGSGKPSSGAEVAGVIPPSSHDTYFLRVCTTKSSQANSSSRSVIAEATEAVFTGLEAARSRESPLRKRQRRPSGIETRAADAPTLPRFETTGSTAGCPETAHRCG